MSKRLPHGAGIVIGLLISVPMWLLIWAAVVVMT